MGSMNAGAFVFWNQFTEGNTAARKLVATFIELWSTGKDYGLANWEVETCVLIGGHRLYHKHVNKCTGTQDAQRDDTLIPSSSCFPNCCSSWHMNGEKNGKKNFKMTLNS